MFDGNDFPKSLNEEQFDSWLEDGRDSKMGYAYLLILWDEFDTEYKPAYAERRDQIGDYEKYGESSGRESIVAAYDLYSQSKVSI
ncbi:hypothetical protein [Marinoscillum sp. MHG1-6]|uniref:hypothetical protein n=1 Tax=Marinoscillum sp. MHG1-6 TaxID=2959627 RepID=UPI002157B0EE|nr:hypothetical protein [Marinoscillum sp. MHG1-6]